MASTASSATLDRGPDFSLASATDLQLSRDPLDVKKARIAADPRLEAPKTKALKRPGPARVTSSSSAGTTPTIQEGQAIFGNETIKAPLAENAELKNKDVDQLASGMKKMSIKLKVPPKEEYDARQQKPKPVPRGRPAKSTAPKTTKAASPTKIKAKSMRDVSPPKSRPNELGINQKLPPPAMTPDFAQDTPLFAPVSEPEPFLQPVAQEPYQYQKPPLAHPSEPAPLSYTAQVASTGGLIPKGPNEVEREVEAQKSVASPTTQQSHFPETARPLTPVTAKRTKQDLPVFTSTSPIAFGKPTNINPNINQRIDQNGYASPARKPSAPIQLSEAPALAGAQEQGRLEQQISSRSAMDPEFKMEPQPSPSIWDVPDTPQIRKP